MTDFPLRLRCGFVVFFDTYLAALVRYRVPERQRRWYVKHVEVFI